MTAHDGDAVMESTGLTRRQALKVGAATFVGYAVAVEKVEAQAIKTDTSGIVAGDHTVNPTAAADAWKRCTAHFDKHLKA